MDTDKLYKLNIENMAPHALYRNYVATGKTKVSFELIEKFAYFVADKLVDSGCDVLVEFEKTQTDEYLDSYSNFLSACDNKSDVYGRPNAIEVKGFNGKGIEKFCKFLCDKLKLVQNTPLELNFLLDKDFGKEIFENQSQPGEV